MTRNASLAAFVLGMLIVVWMGTGFVGSNSLALLVTGLIAAAFALGFWELMRFQSDTRGLTAALTALAVKPAQLDEWIGGLPGSLRNAVRKRVEDQHVGLPVPVLTPYLIGLLVMLGLLGTFIGMVSTLQGAVGALEGTTELEAIRAGLAAPIRGLGMAFATSVAGISTSAMLGFISTVSRRQRLLASRLLDDKVRTVMADFSLAQNRQQTYQAMQAQADALPAVASSLQALVERLAGMADQLGQTNTQLAAGLLENQQAFHHSVERNYQALAQSVKTSLEASLAESGRLAGDAIQPVVREVMLDIGQRAADTQQQLQELARQQLASLSGELRANAETLSANWQTALAEQQHSNAALLTRLDASVSRMGEEFGQGREKLLESLQATAEDWFVGQRQAEQSRVDVLNAANAQLANTLQRSAEELSRRAHASSEQLTAKIGAILGTIDGLASSAVERERSWRDDIDQRMVALAESIRVEFERLAVAEAQRGDAAVARLAELETQVAQQLATLGAALEAPMSRLIETASETPRAAAEVIEKLRREMSKTLERDNSLLEERAEIMADLGGLSKSLAESAQAQSVAIDQLLLGTRNSLAEAAEKFDAHLGSGLQSLAAVVDNFASDTVELSSLGDSFSQAVGQFSEANGQLMERLAGLEQAMAQTTERSDEQMAYYVAQAREIIDNSMLSQQEIISQLQAVSRAAANS